MKENVSNPAKSIGQALFTLLILLMMN